MLYSIIQNFANHSANPSVSISLNTHRTHPENQKDIVILKNLCKEAEERLLGEFEKRDILPLLKNLESVQNEVDVNFNLDSLHIFLSNEVKEVVRTIGIVDKEKVQISESFAQRGIINAFNRSKEYFVVLVSQSGINVYQTLDENIHGEIHDEDFPIKESKFFSTDNAERSDSGKTDNLLREYLNRVDKALVKLYNDFELPMVVVSTRDNFQKLMAVADRPNIYLGNVSVNYNDTKPSTLAKDAWELVSKLQFEKRTESLKELAAAVSKGKVLTDLQEIYLAAKQGRGDLLIVNEHFAQPVLVGENDTLQLIDDVTTPNAVDDIVSEIAWEVISKKGRTVFTGQDELETFGKIALKVRW